MGLLIVTSTRMGFAKFQLSFRQFALFTENTIG